MTTQSDSSAANETTPTGRRFFTYRILSGMRIRKKLIVLHTAFSLGLATILLIAIRPAMSKVIFGAETDQSRRIMGLVGDEQYRFDQPGGTRLAESPYIVLEGSDATVGIPDQILYQARQTPGEMVHVPPDTFAAGVIRYMPEQDSFVLVRARSEGARDAIQLVYLLVIAILLIGYGLVAAALELFVLPQHVYRPISAMLQADQSVAQGDREREIIPDHEIPADELGAIMRSRNEAIHALRTHEHELADALDRLEHTAADLHKKNHLLETARKNLEGADRLASLGMMSAGIAHELNTPLAVVKGLVEKLNRESELKPTEIALLVRVVGRLETLSEGLLDFARVRPPMNKEADLIELITEAKTLVMIDRKGAEKQVSITIEPDQQQILIQCDPDRLVQVFVNLIRNAVDAIVESETQVPRVEVRVERESRESTPWVAVRVIDNGPGIDAELIDRLFEPFVSSRLDAQGTGLGLAVANGIIREHGGLLTATNRTGQGNRGAVFEALLPQRRDSATDSGG
ncbi:MAG: sensor histidine kinase [Phycisphaerales bacterium]